MFAAFLAVLGFPAPLLEPSFDYDAVPFCQILAAMFSLFSEHDDVDKGDFFFDLLSLLPATIDPKSKRCDRGSRWTEPGFRS